MNNVTLSNPEIIANQTNLPLPNISNLSITNTNTQIVAKRKFCEITEDNLDTGLRGIPVGYCTTSTVDPYKGLYYVEQPISKLVHLSPEWVIYLLYKGKFGSKEEVADFSNDLRLRTFRVFDVFTQISKLPKYGNPLELFQIALQLYGMSQGLRRDNKNDYEEDCLQVIAVAPMLAAAIINHLKGEKSVPVFYGPSCDYIEHFVDLLDLKMSPEQKVRITEILKLFNILHYDHGGGNLSTFVGKAVASGLENMYGSISASLLALAGPRHGGANCDSLKFIQDMLEQLGPTATEAQVEEFVRKELKNGKVIPGFGHAVLRVEDPRATIFYDYSAKYFSDQPIVKLAFLLRQVAPKVLKENSKISDPYPNVDAISAILLYVAGFKDPKIYPLLFGMSRVVGIAIQIVYERCEARGGKGTPIMRPKYVYVPRNRGGTDVKFGSKLESPNG